MTNDLAQINESYFNELKNLKLDLIESDKSKPIYPSLSEIIFENNSLKYNNKVINLDNTYLKNIDHSIFRLSAKNAIDILFILKEYSSQPQTIEKKYNRIILLMLSQNVSQNDYDEISIYIKEYFNLIELSQKYPNDIIYTYTTKYRQALELCYIDDYNNRPIGKYIETSLNKHIDEFNQSSGNDKNFVRERKSENLIYLPTVQDNEPKSLDSMAGFANTALVISITVTLGLTIAILTLFLK